MASEAAAAWEPGAHQATKEQLASAQDNIEQLMEERKSKHAVCAELFNQNIQMEGEIAALRETMIKAQEDSTRELYEEKTNHKRTQEKLKSCENAYTSAMVENTKLLQAQEANARRLKQLRGDLMSKEAELNALKKTHPDLVGEEDRDMEITQGQLLEQNANATATVAEQEPDVDMTDHDDMNKPEGDDSNHTPSAGDSPRPPKFKKSARTARGNRKNKKVRKAADKFRVKTLLFRYGKKWLRIHQQKRATTDLHQDSGQGLVPKATTFVPGIVAATPSSMTIGMAAYDAEYPNAFHQQLPRARGRWT